MIRKATLKDIDFIYQMSSENLETSFLKETLKDYIESDQTYHVFCLEEATLMGYMIIWESASYGQIIDLVIDRKYRGKGLGLKMVNFAIDYFKSNGINIVSLEVKVSNHAAIKLYEKAGFRNDHTIKNYYKTEDAYFYVRRLNI